MTKFQDVGAVSDVADGEMKCVFAGETRILLVNVDGVIHATTDICSHALAYLSDGFLDGAIVECPLHGAQFDVRTGKALSPPADKDIKVFEVNVTDGRITVALS